MPPNHQQQRGRPAQHQALATVGPRLPYAKDLKADGIDEGRWRVLIDAIFPSARTPEAVRMAIDYCRARNLDVMKKPVHIVPMYSTVLKRMVETVWPSISEIRTTASRTGEYAGCDEAVFGEEVTETFTGTKEWDGQRENVTATVTYPSWCRITVYKIVGGHRVAFPGPRVLWKETYARQGKADVPNAMWCQRPSGQLEKCAEAAALRKAFPEELGNEYAAEEMEGREIAAGQWAAVPADAPPPARPTREQFSDARVTDVASEPTEDKPAAEAAPIKPVHVPLDGQTGEPDWPRWQTAILAAVLRCPNETLLSEWWEAQASAFEHFSMDCPEKAGAMQETVDLRFKELGTIAEAA
jgi:phage recombination protein Bet